MQSGGVAKHQPKLFTTTKLSNLTAKWDVIEIVLYTFHSGGIYSRLECLLAKLYSA